MTQLIEFASNHFILVSAFIFILAMLVINMFQGGGAKTVLPVQAVRMLNREGALTLDIRSVAEFENGHIINARNIPSTDLKSRIHELSKFKDRPIVVCCARGTTSGAALRELSGAGFEQVRSLKGGVAAWRSDNLPLTSG